MKTNAAMVMVNRLSTNHAERLNAAATMNGCVECEEGESCNFKGECISCTSLRSSTSKCFVLLSCDFRCI